METYSEMLNKAQKAKATRNLTPEFHPWGEPGDMIVGAFISKAPVSSGLGGKDYNQYLFDTDDGLVKLSLGSAADAEYADQFAPGMVYAVKFQGQEKIKGGRSVNKFEVFEVGTAPASAEPKTKPKASG